MLEAGDCIMEELFVFIMDLWCSKVCNKAAHELADDMGAQLGCRVCYFVVSNGSVFVNALVNNESVVVVG
jgi:hypothetical protein